MASQRLIFRARAVNDYSRRRQRDVLPHLMNSSLFFLLWLLLALLVITMILLLPGLTGAIGG